MSDPSGQDPRRNLPPVHELVDRPEVVEGAGAMARPFRVRLARSLLDEIRSGVLRVQGDVSGFLDRELVRRAQRLLEPGPGPVLNATGVPLHTNLGRSPLGGPVREAMSRAAGYSDLEMDLRSGKRGDRNRGLSGMLALLCETDAGLAVNNGAAAALLAARALARGGEILVSRGELVEIGGSFRVPDVIESAGAKLVEVGTTNRTRASDYAAAITPGTRMIMKIHRSNFRLEGFTQSATREELAEVAREAGIPLVEDLGSGCFVPLQPYGLSDEPTPEQVLAAGVDVVTFSGDKLLGGCQAGLVAGREELVTRLAKDPLMRALRLDKVMTAGVLAALSSYLREDGYAGRLPVHRMMGRTPEELEGACARFVPVLEELGFEVEVVDGTAPVGGGSCPGETLAGRMVRFSHPEEKPDRVARKLRTGRPPMVVRIEEDRLILDPRTLEGEIETALRVLGEALGG